MFGLLAFIFLAAYTAVNIMRTLGGILMNFLAAYTAVN
ncbi:hypothetical protein PA18A_5145 [Pseudomonas aeruginosa 18A]|nr:hypothetical protein PA18A_5145 [Pseudomonas aeruginosa 18A]